METLEVVTAVAAVVSAVGGAFAAVAAFRSAESARVAQRAADAAEHRASIRQVGTSASEILIEARRLEARSADLRLAIGTQASFVGQRGGSREKLALAAVDKTLERASDAVNYAKRFSPNVNVPSAALEEDVDRVHVLLASKLVEVRALREDVERELVRVEAQSAAYRDKLP